MPSSEFSPDLLLTVGADLTALQSQLAQLQRQLSVQIGIAGGPQSIQQAAAELRTVQTETGRVATSLNEASRAAGGTADELKKIRMEEERRGREFQMQWRAQIAAYDERERRTRQAGVLQAQAFAENERRVRQGGVLQSQAFAENERRVRQGGVLQSQAFAENERRTVAQTNQLLQQMRTMEQFQARLATLTVPAGFDRQLSAISAANARLQQGIPLTTTEWAKLRLEMDQVARAAGANTGAFAGLAGTISGVVRWATIWTAAYAGIRAVMSGVGYLANVDQALTKISTTLENTPQKASQLRMAYDLLRDATTRYGVSQKDASELMFELFKALNGNQALIRAAYLPALALTITGEVNRGEAVRVLIGLYNLYGDTLKGATTESEKYSRISELLLNTSFAAVASTQGFLEALQLVAPRAKGAGVSLEDLLTLLKLLTDSLLASGRSGTGLARLFTDLTANAERAAKVFEIEFDPKKVVDPIQLLFKVVEKIRKEVEAAGGATGVLRQKMEIAFPLEQASRVLEIFVEQLGKYKSAHEEVSAVTGRVQTVLEEWSKGVTQAANRLGATLVLELDRLLSLLSGLEPGKMQGVAAGFDFLTEKAKGLSEKGLAPLAVLLGYIVRTLANPEVPAKSFGEWIDQMLGFVKGEAGPGAALGNILSRMFKGGSQDWAATLKGMKEFQAQQGISDLSDIYAGLATPPAGPPAKPKAGPMAFPRWEKRFAEMRAEAQREIDIANRSLTIEERTVEALIEQEKIQKQVAETKAKGPQTEKEVQQLLNQEVQITKKINDFRRQGDEQTRKEVQAILQLNNEVASEQVRMVRDLETDDLRRIELTKQAEIEDAERIADQRLKQAAQTYRGLQDSDERFTEARRTINNDLIFDIQMAEIKASKATSDLRQKDYEEFLKLTETRVEAAGQAYEKEYSTLLEKNQRGHISDEEFVKGAKELTDRHLDQQQQAYLQDIKTKAATEVRKLNILENAQAKEILFEAAKIQKRRAQDQLLLDSTAEVNAKRIANIDETAVQELELAAATVTKVIRERNREIDALKILNRAHENFTRQRLEREQEVARAHGDVVGFFTAGFQRSLFEGTNFWNSLDKLATDTAKSMTQSLSDLFFNVFTGQVTSAQDLWKGFMNSMLRAMADFLATQTVATFMSILMGSPGRGGFGFGGAGQVNPAALAQLASSGAFTAAQIQALQQANQLPPPGLASPGQTLLGSTSLAAAFPGIANIGANFAQGGIHGALFGLPTGFGGAGVGLEAVTSATPGLFGAGGAISGFGTALVGIGTAFNLISGFTTGNVPQLAGTGIGAGIGALVGSFIPGVGTLAGALLGGSGGGFLGDLFGGLFGDDKPSVPAWQRSLEEGNRAIGQFSGALNSAQTVSEMIRIIGQGGFAAHGEVQVGSVGRSYTGGNYSPAEGFGWAGDYDDAESPQWGQIIQALSTPAGATANLGLLSRFIEGLWIQGPGQTGVVPFNPEFTRSVQEKLIALANAGRFQLGGWVPGVGSGDIMPALLEPREFIVRRPVAEAYAPELDTLGRTGRWPGGGATLYIAPGAIVVNGSSSPKETAHAILNHLEHSVRFGKFGRIIAARTA